MNDNFIHDLLTRGEAGKKWLDTLPQLIKLFEDKWQIKVGKPYDLSYNYVTPATRSDGTKTVLKIVFPGNVGFLSEVSALRIFAGDGSIKLLEVDKENLGMLLERAEPGERLSHLENDEEATKILARIIKKLRKPAPKTHELKPVADFAHNIPKYKKQFAGAKNPLPLHLIDKAETLLNELIKTTTEQVVLHGDLHQGNVLSAEREPWLAIDPKGLAGDPVYETGAMMRNPYPILAKQPNVKDILIRRIKILSNELNLDPLRIQKWGFVQTVLSAVYRVEDHGDNAWKHAVAIAELLDIMKF